MRRSNQILNDWAVNNVPLCDRAETVDNAVSELEKQLKFTQAFGGQYIPMGHNVTIKLTNRRYYTGSSLPENDSNNSAWLMTYGTTPVSIILSNWNSLLLWLENALMKRITPDVLYVVLPQSDEIDLCELTKALDCLNPPTSYILNLLTEFNNSRVARNPMGGLEILERNKLNLHTKIELGITQAERTMRGIEYQVQNALCEQMRTLSLKMENAAKNSLTGAALAYNNNAVMIEADQFERMPVNFLKDYREATTVTEHAVDIETGLCGTLPKKMIDLQENAKKRPSHNFIGRRKIEKAPPSNGSKSKNPMRHLNSQSNSRDNVIHHSDRMFGENFNGRTDHPSRHRTPSSEKEQSSSVVERKKNLGLSTYNKRKRNPPWHNDENHKRGRDEDDRHSGRRFK